MVQPAHATIYYRNSSNSNIIYPINTYSYLVLHGCITRLTRHYSVVGYQCVEKRESNVSCINTFKIKYTWLEKENSTKQVQQSAHHSTAQQKHTAHGNTRLRIKHHHLVDRALLTRPQVSGLFCSQRCGWCSSRSSASLSTKRMSWGACIHYVVSHCGCASLRAEQVATALWCTHRE